ncbi:iron compound ABC transporter iron compound-binding protein [Paenibacillus albidus]|uniref:Iron compound ABC transporter iron compound-binding protein n=1 Tax=Paenibacillus albidus TaxID=2041023 RepID=A0A917FLZ9_9BACL|nr:ABC transporter substrate-binding protein [Paenibacillus albidus]GGF88532.1 iron compound ABC transporter iron compound-binding protein [Paenibacillus albidus]
MLKQWRSPLLLLTLCSLLLTACGPGGQREVIAATSTGQPLTLTDFTGRELSFPGIPKHIVALGSGEADIILALGGALVGRPTSTGTTPVKGTEEIMQVGSAHEVDLEKIAYLKADAVLGNAQLNAKDIPALEGVGAQLVLTQAHSVTDITRQILLFGQMLNKEQQAQQIISGIEAEVQSAAAASTRQKPRVLLVYGAPGTYMAALPNSLGGNILELAGGVNIAADYPALQSYPQYATLNTERIVEANPQFILIMTHGNAAEVQQGFEQEMRQNAAWSSLDAVVHNRVSVLPAELFGTNPGTRVTESLQMLITLFSNLELQ